MLRDDTPDWMAAGGDPTLLEVLARAGRVATFSEGGARCLASIHPDAPDRGAIGDWVGPPDVLRAAEAWLAAQGCVDVRGPMLLCPWFPHGATLGPFEADPLIAESTEPGSRWEAAGYTPLRNYVSILAQHAPNIQVGMDIAAGLASRGWSLDPLDVAEGFDTTARTLQAVAALAYAPDPAVSAEVLAAFYRPRIEGLDVGLSRLARTPSGEPAGYILALSAARSPGASPGGFPDSWVEIVDLAVVPAHRQRGIATWMAAVVHQAARRAGLAAGVHTMVEVKEGLEDTTWFRGEVLRRYALFAKPLSAPNSGTP